MFEGPVRLAHTKVKLFMRSGQMQLCRNKTMPIQMMYLWCFNKLIFQLIVFIN